MRDLKIRPGMDTPKAKLKNPTPKDAESILKKHMDKRQREKEPRPCALCYRPRGEKYAPGCGWGGGCLATHDKALPRKAETG